MTVAGAQIKNIRADIQAGDLERCDFIKTVDKIKDNDTVNDAQAEDLEENDPTNYIANKKVYDEDLVAVADTAGGIVNISYTRPDFLRLPLPTR